MSNSKVRCNVCRNYFPAGEMFKSGLGGFGGVCSEDCFEAYLEKYRTKRVRRKMHREMRYSSPGKIPGSVRLRVRRRDDDRCRWCGAQEELQIHHVRYRSEGGPDHQHNLITLCADHHALAHTNKKKYQPVLLLWLYAYYCPMGAMTERGFTIIDTSVETIPATFRLAKEYPTLVDDARAFSNEVMRYGKEDDALVSRD